MGIQLTDWACRRLLLEVGRFPKMKNVQSELIYLLHQSGHINRTRTLVKLNIILGLLNHTLQLAAVSFVLYLRHL